MIIRRTERRNIAIEVIESHFVVFIVISSGVSHGMHNAQYFVILHHLASRTNSAYDFARLQCLWPSNTLRYDRRICGRCDYLSLRFDIRSCAITAAAITTRVVTNDSIGMAIISSVAIVMVCNAVFD